MRLAMNALYALGNCVLGFYVHSWWFITMGAYYAVLAVTRFCVLQVKRKAGGDYEMELFAKKIAGVDIFEGHGSLLWEGSDIEALKAFNWQSQEHCVKNAQKIAVGNDDDTVVFAFFDHFEKGEEPLPLVPAAFGIGEHF